MYAMIHSYRVPVYNARRFNCDSTAYPRTLRLSAVMTRLLPARRSIAQGQ